MTEAALLALKLTGLWLVLMALGAWAAALAYPLYRRFLSPLAPHWRSTLRLVYGLMPVIAASLVLLLVANPGLAEWSGQWVPEHCHGDDCGAHAPVFGAGSLASAAFAGFGLLGGFFALGVVAWLLGRAVSRLRMLERLTRRPGPGSSLRVLDSDGFVACCVGLLRPRVLVSQGAIDALPAAQFEAVLAHEQAHARRRDNLRAFVLHAATLAWPASRRRSLRGDLAADAEQACDAEAAAQTGNPAAVIDALRRLGMPDPTLPLRRGAAFGEGDAAERILRLRDNETAATGPGLAMGVLGGAWLALVALLAALSHLFMEWLTAAGL